MKKSTFHYSEKKYNEALEEQAHYNFLGFTIYDVVHILFGLYFLVFYILREPENHFEIAECIVEIVISVTLIGFIHAIAVSEHGDAMNRTYTYAWLLACVSLLIPALFKGVSLIGTEIDAKGIVTLAGLVVCVLMFAAFFTSLFVVKKRSLWMALLYLGMVFFGLSAILEFVGQFLQTFPATLLEMINFGLLLIKYAVPLVPVILGITALYRVDRQINGKFL